MPSTFTNQYQRIYDSYKRSSGSNQAWRSKLPANIQRKIATQFASRQIDAIRQYSGNATGTILDNIKNSFEGFTVIEAPEEDHIFVINDIKFTINPQQLTVSEESFTHKSWTLRTSGAMKVKSGRSVIYVGAQIPIVGLRDINSKLLRLLVELRTLPIVYIDNPIVRQTVHLHAYKNNIAAVVRNATITTHPEAVDTLILHLDMEIFNYAPYSSNFYFRGIKKHNLSTKDAAKIKQELLKNTKAQKGKLNSSAIAPGKDLYYPTFVKTPFESQVFQLYYDQLSGTKISDNAIYDDPNSNAINKVANFLPDFTNLKGNYIHLPINNREQRISNQIRFYYYVYKVFSNADIVAKAKEVSKELSQLNNQATATNFNYDNKGEKIPDASRIVKYAARYLTNKPYSQRDFTGKVNGKGPQFFDCSGLPAYAYRQNGIPSMVDGSFNIYKYCKEGPPAMIYDPKTKKTYPAKSNIVTPIQARHIPGAIYFEFKNGDPTSRSGNHVGLSVGDGIHTVEALNKKRRSIIKRGARTSDWTHAALVPGAIYGMHTTDMVIEGLYGPNWKAVGNKKFQYTKNQFAVSQNILRSLILNNGKVAEPIKEGTGSKQTLTNKDVQSQASRALENLRETKKADEKIVKDKTIETGTKSEQFIKLWMEQVEKFIDDNPLWELIWTRDGSAVLRKEIAHHFGDRGHGDTKPWATPVNITASIHHIFARIPMIGQQIATHQYMGSGDGDITISFHVIGNARISELKQMHRYNETVARYMRKIPEAGVISVRNDVTDLMGFQKFIIDNITVDTVPDSPNLYKVGMKLTEWKRDYDNSETVALEFATNKSLQEAALARLGEIWSGLNPSLRQQGNQRKLHPVKKEDISDSMGIVYNQAINKQNPYSTSHIVVQALTEITQAIDSYLRDIYSSNVFVLLGYDKKSLEEAFRNEKSPLYMYGFHSFMFNNLNYEAGLYESPVFLNTHYGIGGLRAISISGYDARFYTPANLNLAKIVYEGVSNKRRFYNTGSGIGDLFINNGIVIWKDYLKLISEGIEGVASFHRDAGQKYARLYKQVNNLVKPGFENITVMAKTKFKEMFIRKAQFKAAVQVIARFESLRIDMGKIFKRSQKRFLLDASLMEEVRKRWDKDSTFYSGRPAYEDIPAVRYKAFNFQTDQEEYIHSNPDIYFHNHADTVNQDYKKIAQSIKASYMTPSFNLIEDFSVQINGINKYGIQTIDPSKGQKNSKLKKGRFVDNPSPATVNRSSIKKNLPDLPESIISNFRHASLVTSFIPGRRGKDKIEMTPTPSNPSGDKGSTIVHFGESDSFVSRQMMTPEAQRKAHETVHFGTFGLDIRTKTKLDRSPKSVQEMLISASAGYEDKTFMMRRALPAFKLFFVERDTSGFGGTNKSYIHSYDDFFSYSAVKSIKLVKSRKMPADLLIIRLSNLYGHLDSLKFTGGTPGSQKHDKGLLSQKKSSNIKESLNPLYQDTAKENPFARLVLKEGMTTYLHLGYDNNTSQLERVFNGQVVQINEVNGDEIVLVCQSFGTQLTAYEKGIHKTAIKSDWRDTFELLSWLVCQPEMNRFGRWRLDGGKSITESRTTGGWEQVFSFLEKPQDDNIYAPNREDVVDYLQELGTLELLFGKSTSGIMKAVIPFAVNKEEGGRTQVEIKILNKAYNKDKKNSKIKEYIYEPAFLLVGRGQSALLDYQIYRTTIWDVFKEMELRHPGWIGHPVEYGDRMTMFFGLPTQFYWSRPPNALERTTYSKLKRRLNQIINTSEVLKQNKADTSSKIGHVLNKKIFQSNFYSYALSALAIGAFLTASPIAAAAVVLGVGFKLYGYYSTKTVLTELASKQRLEGVKEIHQESYLQSIRSGRLKPFRKYHLFDSDHHIIANTIKASSHGIYNAVSLRYSESVDGVDVEKRSNPESLATDQLKASDRLQDKDVHMLSASYPNCRTKYMANRYMQGLLWRHMKDVYKGSLHIIGDPSIKPYDVCLISDRYTNMSGAFEVEQVIHTISPEGGFTTEITPDLLMYGNNMVDLPYDDYWSAYLVFNQLKQGEALDTFMTHKGLRRTQNKFRDMAKNKPGEKVGIHSYYGTGSNTSGAYQTGYFSQKNPGGTLSQVAPAALAVGAGAAGLATASALSSTGMIAGAVLASGFATLGIGAIGAGIGYIAYKTAANLIMSKLATKFYDWTVKRQPLIYQPLMLSGRPYIAGVGTFDSLNMITFLGEKFELTTTNIQRGISVQMNAADEWMDWYNRSSHTEVT